MANAVGKASQCYDVLVPPRFVSSPNTSAVCGTPFRYSGERLPQVEGTGPFSFSLVPLAGASLPAGLTIDSETGEFFWNTTNEDRGTYPLELRVSGPGGEVSQIFAIQIECADTRQLNVGCGCASLFDASWLLSAMVWWWLIGLRLRRST